HIRNAAAPRGDGHHGGRCFGNRAAGSLEARDVDSIVLYPQVHAHAIAAQRIESLGLAISALRPPVVAGRSTVVDDEILIQLAQLGNHRSTSRAVRRPRTSAPTSSCVL